MEKTRPNYLIRLYARKPHPTSGTAQLRFLDSITVPDLTVDWEAQMSRLLRHRLRKGEHLTSKLVGVAA